jgi:hypothetical protein
MANLHVLNDVHSALLDRVVTEVNAFATSSVPAFKVPEDHNDNEATTEEAIFLAHTDCFLRDIKIVPAITTKVPGGANIKLSFLHRRAGASLATICEFVTTAAGSAAAMTAGTVYSLSNTAHALTGAFSSSGLALTAGDTIGLAITIGGAGDNQQGLAVFLDVAPLANKIVTEPTNFPAFPDFGSKARTA